MLAFGRNRDATFVLSAIDRHLALIEFEPDGKIITANEKFCAALGYSLSEIKGKRHGMFCDPGYVNSPEYGAFWQKLARGESDRKDYLRLCKGGQKLWITASYNPVTNGSGKVYKVVKIVTEASASQSAFSVTASGLDKGNVLKALDRSQAIIEFEPNGTILWANANFCKAMGYDLSEIQGRHHSMFCASDFVEKDDYKVFWKELAGGTFQSHQYLRLGKGGREVWIQATYNPVKDPDGKVYKVVKVATDITERVATVNMIGEGLKQLSRSNLDFRLEKANDADMASLVEDFNSSVEHQSETIAQVKSTSASINTLTQDIATASSELSKRTEQQAAAVEETSAAVTEVLKTVKAASERADVANLDARKASEVAAQSGTVMTEAVKAIKNIVQSSQEISQIIGVIDEIAFQTNLLALNAGVEAARAGDAGRGFAVVAQEVRSLAQRSAQAAKEIKTLISGSTEQVRQGVALVDKSGKALEEIVAKVAEIGKQIAEIADTSKQQAHSLSEVVIAVSQIDSMTQHNAAMAEESTAAVVSMRNETQNLFNLVDQFKVSRQRDGLAANPVRRQQVEIARALSA